MLGSMLIDDDTAHVRARAKRNAWRRWAALGGLLLAEAMNLLDATITTVAAPVIRSALAGPASSIQWIAAAYSLAFAITLIPGGRLGDRYGRRRVFVIAMAGFLLSSLTCAAAPNLSVLLLSRAVQGAFAGLVIPQTFGLIKALFHGPTLGKALSLIGPVMGLTAVAGPVLGGVLTHADVAGLSWRAVFLINLPLGVAVLASACLLVEDRAARKPGLDIVGVLLSAVVATALIAPTINDSMPWLLKVAYVTGAVVAAIALIAHVRRLGNKGGDPIAEPSLFRGGGFPWALATSAVYFAVSTGLVFAVVVYVQDGLHRSVLSASLTVLPFSLGLAAASLLAGQILLPRFGSGLMLPGIGILGLACLAGAVASSLSEPAVRSVSVPAALALAGLGGGLLTVPFFTTALARVQRHETGSAAGLLNSVQQLGGTIGVAVLGTVYLHESSRPGHALGFVFATCAALVLLLILTATAMLRAQPADRGC